MIDEEDLLPLSGIQHFVYCRRQWALIHIEQLWQENFLTAEGRLLHERAHNEQLREKRGSLIICRSLALHSLTLGLSGQADVVEFHQAVNGIALAGEKGLWQPLPIEYKRGQPKEHDADELQLTAQALCLEEMLCCSIPHGYLFYNEPHRRLLVEFSAARRQRVAEVAQEMRGYYERRYTPRVKKNKGCRSCSLAELCLPELGTGKSAVDYIRTEAPL